MGLITRVIISDGAFPFDYSDINQFNNCLSVTVVKGNLDIITQKVDQDTYLMIILSKLRQVRDVCSTVCNYRMGTETS